MLCYVINNEINKGCHKFVLGATEADQKVYANFGFEGLSYRHDYMLKIESSSQIVCYASPI